MELRKVYQETLISLMEKNKKVVMMDADLASASGSSDTFARFKDQCINCGISEANMISAAAGMSLTGIKPFVHTFSPFATRRVADQIFMSAAYSKNPIHIFGSDPGFWAQHNGGTHTSYEDIAIMNSIPEVVVTAPSDGHQFKWILEEFVDRDQVFYTRAMRKDTPEIHSADTKFEFGKSIFLNKGSKVAILAIGDMVTEALRAAEILKGEGLDATVVDVFFIKPFDKEMLQQVAKDHNLIVTIENHSEIGGLGSTVARHLALSDYKGSFEMVAVEDKFGEVGEADFLRAKHNLNAEGIITKVKKHHKTK